MKRYKPIVLIICSGWGMGRNKPNNAIASAAIPNFNAFLKSYPATQITNPAEPVLRTPEWAYVNVGAGRFIASELVRINNAIHERSFYTNPILISAFKRVKQENTRLHCIGLISDAGIHSHLDHLYAILTLAKEIGVKSVYIHAILDGRDTVGKTGKEYLSEVEMKLKELRIGQIVSLIGRYYAMDRNQQWERTQLAYQLFVERKGLAFPSASRAISYAYKQQENDEFMLPKVINERFQNRPRNSNDSNSGSGIRDGDTVIMFNFRGDRLIQLLTSLTADEFPYFARGKVPQAEYITLAHYDTIDLVPAVFPKQEICNSLGEVISNHGLSQLRLGETERFAHLTYFFNGLRPTKFAGEDRILIHSPKTETYALKPEMSARKITESALVQIQSGKYDFIVINYANLALVANTGDLSATKRAVETVDEQIGIVVNSVLSQYGVVIITSELGGAEEISAIRQPPNHALNSPLPFIIIGLQEPIQLRNDGTIADIAPTILELLQLPQPEEMTGKSLMITA
ncbi:MAG: 2,3-bisphosphoglycerate-independent phosphoglycerate mutase [bacterium]|nr:2,3-bisphosphoglycerate-independent phosphoglycerate mutase [bacterium]